MLVCGLRVAVLAGVGLLCWCGFDIVMVIPCRLSSGAILSSGSVCVDLCGFGVCCDCGICCGELWFKRGGCGVFLCFGWFCVVTV